MSSFTVAEKLLYMFSAAHPTRGEKRKEEKLKINFYDIMKHSVSSSLATRLSGRVANLCHPNVLLKLLQYPGPVVAARRTSFYLFSSIFFCNGGSFERSLNIL